MSPLAHALADGGPGSGSWRVAGAEAAMTGGAHRCCAPARAPAASAGTCPGDGAGSSPLPRARTNSRRNGG
ncbi:hypothetical protein [Streptomyces klenkii]|uniref:hypothetical protein n=1 Tax=Streptomyces klenkii TaxID=1420899 RepID=UPI00343A52C7